MKHEMRLYAKQFEEVLSGKKRREYRLYDEKRRKIRVGDTIAFSNMQTNEIVDATVTGVHIYKDFRTCYQAFWAEDFAGQYRTVEEAVAVTYRDWWPRESERKYGCIILEISTGAEYPPYRSTTKSGSLSVSHEISSAVRSSQPATVSLDSFAICTSGLSAVI